MRRFLRPLPAALLTALLVVLLAGCAAEPGSDSTTATSLPTTVPPSTGPEPTSTIAVPSTQAPTTPPTTVAETTVTTLAPLEGLAYAEPVSADFPIVLASPPGGGPALLAERRGALFRFEDGQVGEQVGDLSPISRTEGELGLLGMTFHPEDPGRLFIHFSDTSGDTAVSEFASDGDEVDLDSEQRLLSIDQPASNHNGGMIQFGPDGALYVGLGDGGGAGDQFGHGQNPDTLLAGIVRLDVESGEATLWQFGLRNPWRFWIEGEDIWIADVGQEAFEEINLAPITAEGLNYGWSITEGAHCFEASECDTDGLTMPLVEIERGDGGSCSITGGVVYRGEAIPELDGRFLFSDYCGGFLRSVDRNGSVEDHTGEVGTVEQVVSFGVDDEGEVYVLTEVEILKLVPVR